MTCAFICACAYLLRLDTPSVTVRQPVAGRSFEGMDNNTDEGIDNNTDDSPSEPVKGDNAV